MKNIRIRQVEPICTPIYTFPPAPVSLHSSGIWIRSSVFVGLTVVTKRQTDHATCVATGRIFTLRIAMRPKSYSERQHWQHRFTGHDDETMKYRQHVVKLYKISRTASSTL